MAGIIKHVAQVERAWVTFLSTGDTTVFAVTDDDADGFLLVGGETLADVLAQAAEQARHTEQVFSASAISARRWRPRPTSYRGSPPV